jgi:signal transduction histidine kinase
MRLTLAVALGGALLLAGIGWMAYDFHAAWLTFAMFAPIGAASVLAARLLVARRARLGGLRRQSLAVATLIALQAAGVVGVFVWRMFLSPHDAFFAALLATDALLVAAICGTLLARGAMADLDAVRTTLHAVAEGRRDVVTGVRGGGELGELAHEVDAMVARLDGEERARRALVVAVSHDLRTPITSLRLLADAIGDGIVDERTARDYAARISTHVQALGALIEDLFELSRLEAGELHWSMRQVAVDELIRETVEAMRPQADASSVAIRAVLEADGPIAHGDPARLQRVLFNLIQNAIRHTPADGTVTVHTSHAADGLQIEVADTGTGIPEGEREHVFTPFHRLDPSRTDGGSGLGLAIARAIVEAHGGRIWVADAETGASVRILLRGPSDGLTATA